MLMCLRCYSVKRAKVKLFGSAAIIWKRTSITVIIINNIGIIRALAIISTYIIIITTVYMYIGNIVNENIESIVPQF